MNCAKCNAVLPQGAGFCRECGQKVESVATPKEGNDKKSLWGGIVSIVVFILVFSAFRYLGQEAVSSNLTTQDSVSNSELISNTVREVKSTTSLPAQIDEVTIWDDISAQPNALRYHYTLVGADTSNLSSSYLKSYISPGLCQNSDTRDILDRGIAMEYAYAVQGSAQNYFFSITKSDCL